MAIRITRTFNLNFFDHWKCEFRNGRDRYTNTHMYKGT